MFAAATSFFARTNIHQNYNFGAAPGSSRPATPGTAATAATSINGPAPPTPTFHVGLWKVQSAWHKVTNKRVSVWLFDKRGTDMERLTPQSKERALEVMKLEATSLGRLRHPSILEMVEPMEETRNEVLFATEPVLASLALAIPDSGRSSSSVELDEIEIQKGILQLCKGLSFLHNSAKIVHSNICPESIIINSAGDWKIFGLGLTIPLSSRWEFPTYDGRAPDYIQRSFDYMAPEYALDEQLVAESDMYSLGCVVYAVHCKGNPPHKNHGSLRGLRENVTKPIPGMERLDPDLQKLLRSLITRHYGNRPSPKALPTQSFFSSLPISTLNFLDRSNFTTKTREEKISFMKGLAGVLDRFSDGLKTRKILPSLLEEMKDTNLLPYILPNVFAISNALSPAQFATTVLPSLKPLFAIKEPPQNMLTLLDNLTMIQSKTEKPVFREHVLPLVYNALDSEHALVQERALKCVPELCESIDYAEVQSVLFPRVALVFTKTRILSVKVATLATFLAMIKTLDQSSLTQKLVPLLSKIKTKEPSVMMATLDVQEAMGFKVDREAVATLVLPQLWTLSMGPLLNVGQFQRFMAVIKRLGERVEKEHDQYLRDSQRIEDRSAISATNSTGATGVAVDFESLVHRNNGSVPGIAKSQSDGAAGGSTTSWDDDVWGSIFNGDGPSSPVTTSTPSPAIISQASSMSPPPPSTHTATTPRPAFQARPSKLGSASTLGPSVSRTPASLSTQPAKISLDSFPPPTTRTTTTTSTFSSVPILPSPPTLGSSNTMSMGGLSLTPSKPQPPVQQTYSAPNYNLYGTSPSPSTPSFGPFSMATNGGGLNPTMSMNQTQTTFAALQPAAAFPPPIMGGGILTPSKPPSSAPKGFSKDDWGDFDPLS